MMYPQPVGMSEYEEMQAQGREEAQGRFESMQEAQHRANALVFAVTLLLLVIVACVGAGLWWLGRLVWHWWLTR